MVSKVFLLLVLLLVCGAAGTHDHNSKNASHLAGIEFPEHPSFNAVTSSATTGCSLPNSKKSNPSEDEGFDNRDDDDDDDDDDKEEMKGGGGGVGGDGKQTVKLDLKRRSARREKEKESVVESKMRDLARIQTLYRRMTENKNQNRVSRLKKEQSKPQAAPAAAPESSGSLLSGQLIATLESGVSLGSGEYFMDVFVGTPPKHFSLILDTGSDLNWIQCEPCYDCFEQNGPHYDPAQSSSYRNIGCHDPRCPLVSSPDPPQPCKAENQTCPYYYWYGDSSNTTGDFALETFTVNLTMPSGKPEFRKVENVMFGCGHWNRGLFHGAAGLLGLGKGALSFSSQLQSLYGHSFSYCLVDRDSDANVSSKLIFGEDKDLLSRPDLNFTTLVAGKKTRLIHFIMSRLNPLWLGERLSIFQRTCGSFPLMVLVVQSLIPALRLVTLLSLHIRLSRMHSWPR